MMLDLSALTLLVVGAGAPGSLTDQATQAYRAHRYAEACRLFQKAVDASPVGGERWADLGLCLEKLGRKQEAIAAELRAAELGDGPTRLHAYFNLHQLGHAVAGASDAGCMPLRASGTCAEQLTACPYTDASESGTGISVEARGLAFCPRGVEAEGFPPAQRTLGQLACFTLETGRDEQSHCRPGDVGGASCGICDCSTAKDPAACETAVDACNSSASTSEARECHLVFADGCRLRLGAVCRVDGQWVAREVSAPGSLNAPFDAFHAFDLARALSGPALNDPTDDASGWLRAQKVVTLDGGPRLVTLTLERKRADLAVWALEQGRLRLVARSELASLAAGRQGGDLYFLSPSADGELIGLDTLHGASHGYELFVLQGYRAPRVVMRRVHKQGWSGGEGIPMICYDGPIAVLDGGSLLEFETLCRRSTGPGASPAPASRAEVWRWKGDHYEQAPDAGQ